MKILSDDPYSKNTRHLPLLELDSEANNGLRFVSSSGQVTLELVNRKTIGQINHKGNFSIKIMENMLVMTEY